MEENERKAIVEWLRDGTFTTHFVFSWSALLAVLTGKKVVIDGIGTCIADAIERGEYQQDNAR